MRISDWSSDVCSSDLRPRKANATLVKLLEQRQVQSKRIAVFHRLEGDQLAVPVQPPRIVRGAGRADGAFIVGNHPVDLVRPLAGMGERGGVAFSGQRPWSV